MSDGRHMAFARKSLGYAMLILSLGLPHHTWALSVADSELALSACGPYAPATLLGVALGVAAAARVRDCAKRGRGSAPKIRSGLAIVALICGFALVVESIFGLTMGNHGPFSAWLQGAIPVLCFVASRAGTEVLFEAKMCPRGSSEIDTPSPLRLLLVMAVSGGVALFWSWTLVDGWLLPGSSHGVLLVTSLFAALLTSLSVARLARAGLSSASLREISRSAALGVIFACVASEFYGLRPTTSSWLIRLAPLVMAVICWAIDYLVLRRSQRVTASGRDDAVPPSVAALNELPNREREAIEGALEGFTSAQIADHLGIKPATVRSYLQRAYRKLGVTSLRELRGAMGAVDDGESLPTREQKGDARIHPEHALVCRVNACGWLLLVVLLALSPHMGAGVCREAAVLGIGAGLLASGVAFPAPRRRVALVISAAALTVLVGLGFVNPLQLALFELTGADVGVPEASLPLLLPAFLVLGFMLPRALSLMTGDSRETDGGCPARVEPLVVSALFFIARTSDQAWVAIVVISWFVTLTSTAFLAVQATEGEKGALVRPLSRASRCADVSPSPLSGAALFALAFGCSRMAIASDGVAPTLASAMLFVAFVARRLVASAPFGGPNLAYLCSCALLFGLGVLVHPLGMSEPQDLLPAALCAASAFLVLAGAKGSPRREPAILSRPSATAIGLGLLSGHVLSKLCWIGEVIARADPTGRLAPSLSENLAYDAVPFIVYVVGIVACGVLIALKVHESNPARKAFPREAAGEQQLDLLLGLGLSETEARVLAEIARGLSGKEIAEKLSYAIGTVNAARYRGYRKLGINSRHELVSMVGGMRRGCALGADGGDECDGA